LPSRQAKKGANAMKRVLTVALIVFLIVPFISIPGTNADLSRIKVVPYPKTAGKMASYQISFNVSRPLSANQDSITVTLPKETMVPEYVSSSVISVNPKTLIGADYKLNFATGDITFTNPLREGDMIRSAYSYEAKEDYTMMPIQSKVRFFDRSFTVAPPDTRNNNGSFDPGEWVYEDRDSDGRISPGDRRLMIIHGVLGAGDPGAGNPPSTGSFDAKQNSIVASGDGDCIGCATANNNPVAPLLPLSIIKLTMLDIANDGIYNEGDYLFDDRDQSGTVSLGDNMIAGIAYYPPGTTVAFNDPDYRDRTGFFIRTFAPVGGTIYRHVDTGNTVGTYDSGEAIYRECGANTYSVDPGDVRETSVTIIRNGVMMFYPVGSVVVAADADVGMRLVDFKPATGEEEGYLDLSGDTVYDPGEPIYKNGTGRTTFIGGTPEPGDIRLSAWSVSAYEPTSVVTPNDADNGSQLASFNTTPTSRAEMTTIPLIAVNPIFINHTGSRYNNFVPPTTIPSAAYVDACGGCGGGAPPCRTNPGTLDTWLYRDMDGSNNISVGDVRLNNVQIMLANKLIEYSAGSAVKTGEFDMIPLQAGSAPLPLFPVQPDGVGNIMAHAENIKSDNTFNPGEFIYRDMAGGAMSIVDNGDVRMVPVGVTSFGNKPIGNNFPLLGHTLTRGWARIENKVIVPYAQAGTKTAKLDANPLVILPTLEPPMPPAYLKAYPLVIQGGPTPLSGSGKWFIKVTAINMYGEGEFSDSMEVNFVQGDSKNAVEISWKPVPYAIAYRIYKSRNDSYFPPSSLLSKVEAPFTTYIDRGTQITEGTLPFPYKASFVTLWRSRGGAETELVEFRCADYEVDLSTGLIKFRRALRPYEIILANYKYANGKLVLGPGADPCVTVAHKDEHVYVDTVRGIGKLLHTPAIDPLIDPLNYCFRLWRAPSIDPNNPYLLRQGSDYTINYTTGEIKFSSHVVKDGDIITADYDTSEEVVGESLVEAISTGITEARASAPMLPESYVISKAVALKSSPQIRITGGSNGYQLIFTTPVDIFVDPDNNPITPDVVMTLNRPGRQFNTTTKGAVRNPEKAGSYQLWVQTSAEQTPIMSEPYEIKADKDIASSELKIISPQVPAPTPGEPSCTPKDAAANAGQALSIVAQLSSGSNGIPGVYVRFEITTTVNPPSTFTSPNLVQTTDQGLASVVLNLSASPGITEVKIYLQDDPNVCRAVRINTGPQVQVDRIIVNPGPTLALAPGSQQAFTAKAFNTQGAEIQGITFTWAADCGTISPAGVYTAPQNSGSICHVYARAYGKEGMCTINMVNRPSRIVVTPPSATVATNSTLQFSAQAYDDLNNPMSIPITWTVEPNGLGSFDEKGLFKAGTIAGTGTVKASSAGVYGTASISVMAGGAIETVTISPANLTMNVGDTQLFKATAKDKYGIEIGGTSFTWSVNPPDMGTISSSGLFIASKQGMCVIIAQAGDKSGTAIVNIAQITRIDIDPRSLTIEPGKTKQFTATAYNSNNQMVTGVTFTWTVNPSSIGMITQTGMFTCIGMAGQSGIVTASAGGLSATAQVTIGTPDNLGPTITLVAPVADKTNMVPGPTALSFKVDDPSGVSEVLVNAQPAVNNGANWIVNVNIANGINTFVVRAKDASANKNESTYTLTVFGAGPAVLVMKIPTNAQAAVKTVTITENNVPRTVSFKTSPELYNGSTFVGLRDLAESFLGATPALGGSIAYDANQKKITITIKRTNGDTNIFETVVGMKNFQLRIVHPDGTQETINGTMTQAPYIGSAATKSRRENYNSTMVPMRGFVEALGGTVVYVDETRTATFNFTR
jgi:hypothetical protein